VQTQGIPVIVVSTRPGLLDDTRKDPEQYGGDWCLGKPLDLDNLLGAVEQLIGKA
jgi:hypothetical protein